MEPPLSAVAAVAAAAAGSAGLVLGVLAGREIGFSSGGDTAGEKSGPDVGGTACCGAPPAACASK